MSMLFGYLLIAIPFIVVFVVGSIATGVKETLMVFLTVAIVCLMIKIGTGLVSGAIIL